MSGQLNKRKSPSPFWSKFSEEGNNLNSSGKKDLFFLPVMFVRKISTPAYHPKKSSPPRKHDTLPINSTNAYTWVNFPKEILLWENKSASVETDSVLTGGGWLGVQAGVPFSWKRRRPDSPMMRGEQKTQSADRAEETFERFLILSTQTHHQILPVEKKTLIHLWVRSGIAVSLSILNVSFPIISTLICSIETDFSVCSIFKHYSETV